MIKPNEAMKMYEDAIVEAVRKMWTGAFKTDISKFDEEGIREGFYIKGSKYKQLGSGMKHILEIVAATEITQYQGFIEASMLFHDKEYRAYKKRLYNKQYKDNQWDRYYNRLLKKLKEKTSEQNKKQLDSSKA